MVEFLFCKSWMTFHCVYTLHHSIFCFQSSSGGHLNCFHACTVIVNNAAENMRVKLPLQHPDLLSFVYKLRNMIDESYKYFQFLGILHNVAFRDYTASHSHWESASVSTSLYGKCGTCGFCIHYSHPNGFEMIPHCDVGFCFLKIHDISFSLGYLFYISLILWISVGLKVI